MATRARTIPAVVLAAGDGGRLGAHTADAPKPLLRLGARPLIDYTLCALAEAGVEDVVVVTGYRSDQLKESLLRRRPGGVRLSFAYNPQFYRGASYSLRAARPLVDGQSFLLTMSDHLLSTELVAGLLDAARQHPERTFVAADSEERSPRYTQEATKLDIAPGGRVTAIGKGLRHWSAFDAGAFVVRPSIWDAVNAVEEDCELGVIFSELARRGELYAADVSGAFWYDVDTEEDLREAAELLEVPLDPSRLSPRVAVAVDGDPMPV